MRSEETLSTVVIPKSGSVRGGHNCSECERLKLLAIELQEQSDVQGMIIEGLVKGSPVTDDGYGDGAGFDSVKTEQHDAVDAGPTVHGVKGVVDPPSATPAAAASSSSSSSSSSNNSQVR